MSEQVIWEHAASRGIHRLSLGERRGKVFVEVRRWYSKDGVFLPTREGVRFEGQVQVAELVAALELALEAMQATNESLR
jgi:hypothetical protein